MSATFNRLRKSNFWILKPLSEMIKSALARGRSRTLIVLAVIKLMPLVPDMINSHTQTSPKPRWGFSRAIWCFWGAFIGHRLTGGLRQPHRLCRVAPGHQRAPCSRLSQSSPTTKPGPEREDLFPAQVQFISHGIAQPSEISSFIYRTCRFRYTEWRYFCSTGASLDFCI